MKFSEYKTLGFTNWCVENRTTVYILYVSIITLANGFMVCNNLPRAQFRTLKIPQIYINTVYFGNAAPADIRKIRSTKPIEKQLKVS